MDPTFSSSSSIARRTLYSTPLVHSVSRDELEILPRALVCVDSSGIIEWIERIVLGEGFRGGAAAWCRTWRRERWTRREQRWCRHSGGAWRGVHRAGTDRYAHSRSSALQCIAVEADERSTLRSTPTSGTWAPAPAPWMARKAHVPTRGQVRRPRIRPAALHTRWSSGTSTTGSDTSLSSLQLSLTCCRARQCATMPVCTLNPPPPSQMSATREASRLDTTGRRTSADRCQAKELLSARHAWTATARLLLRVDGQVKRKHHRAHLSL